MKNKLKVSTTTSVTLNQVPTFAERKSIMYGFSEAGVNDEAYVHIKSYDSQMDGFSMTITATAEREAIQE